MKKYLIIGSNSFSGSNFVNFILKNSINKIFGVSRSKEESKEFLAYKTNNNLKNFKFFKLNINKKIDRKKIVNLIRKNKIEYIVNFASQGMVSESFSNPSDWYNTNLISTVELIEKIKKENIKSFLHVTTPEVYGNIKTTINERSIKRPSTPYAISRHAMDLHLELIAHLDSFPVKFSRAANVYGAGQQLYRIIPKTIMKIFKNEKIILHGSGLSYRSFIHINDVNRGYMKILHKGKTGSSYHLSNPAIISIKDLVKKICNKLNVNYENFVIESKKDRINKDKIYKLSYKKISKELNWYPKIKLDKGLDMTISWVRKNFYYLKKLDLEYIHKK